MDFKNYRPQGIFQKGDEKFISLIDELFELIIDTSDTFQFDSLRLSNEKFETLSHLLIEFFEDIHFNIGIWKAYENFNEKTFGTKLPFNYIGTNEHLEIDPFSVERIQHFIWNIYEFLEPNFVFSQHHCDLITLAEEISSFISKSKSRFPKESSIKQFLKFNNDNGYDVKKKLIWLGTKSYFFRENFNAYLIKNNYKTEIPVIDDFINQVCTSWSGLGVIDILAEIILIPQSRKDDIKFWYERHASFYLIKSIQGKKINVENIVNRQNYRIFDGGDTTIYSINDVVFGSVVKYGPDWYWSGQQNKFKSFTKEQLDETRKDFISKSSKIVYRYDKQLLEKVIKRNAVHYNEFIEYFGSDFIVFKNGLDFASSMQKKERLKYEQLSEEEFQKYKIKYNLLDKSPNSNFPEVLINSENEIAVFYNINEGIEILSEYNSVKSALNKEGIDLTDEDLEFINAMIEDLSISPDFINKILILNGKKSVLKAYHFKEEKAIDYLIHKYKGGFFKNRYPTLTLVDN